MALVPGDTGRSLLWTFHKSDTEELADKSGCNYALEEPFTTRKIKKGEKEESKGEKKKIYHDQDTVYEDVLPSIPVIIANGRCNSFWLNVDVRPVANGGRLRQTNATLAQFRVVNDVEASRRGTRVCERANNAAQGVLKIL